MKEWFNINRFLVFIARFLLFMGRLRKKQGSMSYTTQSDMMMKTSPSQVFWGILSGE
jgi:hypothetical protein